MQQNNIFSNKLFVPFLAVLACILWGSAFPFLKISYSELKISADDFFTRMLFASYRFFLASIFLFISRLILRGKSSLKIEKSEVKYLFLLGILQTTLQYFFFYNGLANTTAVKGSILITTGIFLTVVVSHFIYKNDKLNYKKVLGLMLGFLGVIIVNLKRGSFTFNFTFMGEGFIIMAAVVSTSASILVKSISSRLDTMLITAYQMLMGSITLFLISLIKVKPTGLNFSPVTLIMLVYLAFVSAAAFGLWYTLIKYNPLGYVTLYKFMTPVSGVFFSTLFLAEEYINLYIVIALLLVSLGIIIINYREKGVVEERG